MLIAVLCIIFTDCDAVNGCTRVFAVPLFIVTFALLCVISDLFN